MIGRILEMGSQPCALVSDIGSSALILSLARNTLIACVDTGLEQIRRGGDLEKRRDGHSTAGMGVSRGPRVPVPVCGSTRDRGFHRCSFDL